MKVTGPGSSRPVNLRRTEKRDDAGAASGKDFKVEDGPQEAGVNPITGSHQVAPVASLLALQEVSDALDGRSRGLAHGRNLLDMLDQVRLGLLLGQIPEAQLLQMMKTLEARQEGFGDPRVDQVIREIETRAAVELAKFDKIREQNQ